MVNRTQGEVPMPAAEDAPSRLPTLSIVRMLWNRKWLVLSVWILASALTIAIVRTLPAVYRAEAVILVDSQKIPENFVSSTVSGDVADRLTLLTQSIMTSTRLLEIINVFHLYGRERSRLTQEELLGKMRDDISITFEKGNGDAGRRTEAFRLAYQGRDAKVVAAVANRLASLYVEENLRTRENQAEGTVDFLARQLQQAKRSLDDQEQRVAQFKQSHNGTLPEQQNSLLGELSSLSMQLEGVQSAIARSHENKMSLEAALSAAESSEATLRASLQRQSRASAQVSIESAILKPRSEILEEQLRQLRTRYTPDHPEVMSLEQQLAEAKREESELDRITPPAANLATRVKDNSQSSQHAAVLSPELLQITERITTLRAQIAVANHQAESLEQEREKLTAEIADCQSHINRLPLVEQEMAALKRNYEESASNYNSLLQKQLAAGIATDMERAQKSERFTVIDAARIPEKPIKPKRPALAIGGCVASLAIALMSGFLLEFRKQRFLGEWELPLGVVVLGRVPLIHMPPVLPVSNES